MIEVEVRETEIEDEEDNETEVRKIGGRLIESEEEKEIM